MPVDGGGISTFGHTGEILPKPLLDRSSYDHPEHFDDEIREYRTSRRYVPTPLESLLFELAGHRCTICHAPWLEIHHITELEHGGETEFENLIVLCPNCHTRVHAQGVPTANELRHYKLKQEIAYELSVLSRLTVEEREFVREAANLPERQQITFSKRHHAEIVAPDHSAAIESHRSNVGLVHLQEFGIVTVDQENVVTLAEGGRVSVVLRVRLTGKGIKWCRYLMASGRLP